MSKLTETSRMKIEDFQDQRRWIAPLLEGYNNFLSQAIKLFNKGLSFVDNFIGIEHEFSFTFQSQAATFPQKVAWPYNRFSPRNLFVTASTEDASEIPIVHSWRFTDERFVELTAVYKITTAPAISDLTSGSKYKIRIRVEP